MSGYIQVEHQLGLSSIEKNRVKQLHEKYCLNHGIMVDAYIADNGVFKNNAFINDIREYPQRLRFCGVNDHHQNRIIEGSINMSLTW